MNDNTFFLEMFGLTYNQTLLMLSVQKLITLYDINNTKDSRIKELKSQWLQEWEHSVEDYFETNSESTVSQLIDDKDKLQSAFKSELADATNLTWYYILVLELIAFVPYTPIGKEKDRAYNKCTFDKKTCYNYLKRLIMEQGQMIGFTIDRLRNTYCTSINKISGKKDRVVRDVMVAVTTTAVTAALATFFAGPIAIAVFGSAFQGLHGVALTSACLAMIGGGAVAVGGTGIAGGVAVVAGGGALLGLAGGGIIARVDFLSQSPDFTLTQAAKLETILKEVILNAQRDIVTAQKIIAQYREQIGEMAKQLTILELQNKKNQDEINSIKSCLKYMKNSCVDLNSFTSSYDSGERISS